MARATPAATPPHWVLWGEHNQPSYLGCGHRKSSKPFPVQVFFHADAAVPALSSHNKVFQGKCKQI